MKHGLTDEQVRSYFSGPAHLPWHRMSNIDYWQGPLPQEWRDGQAELQKKILKRERDLGMTPILPAFAGYLGLQQEFAAFFGGTSLLILVGVILDTLQQIESHLMMRHYDGLLSSGRIKGRVG